MYKLKDIKLKPYQVEGIKFLLKHKHVVLGDEMGLGKTIQALAVASATGLRTLIVCPAYLIPNWRIEIYKFCPHLDYDITSYSPQTLKKKRLLFKEADIVIFDEVHYIKTPSAQRTQVVHQFLEAYPPTYLIGLSGTPVKNRVTEWYSLIYMLCYSKAPNGLKIQDTRQSNYYKFCDYFAYKFKMNIKGCRVVKYEGFRLGREADLRNLLKNKYIRRKANRVLDLPKQNYIYRNLGDDDKELVKAWGEFSSGDEELIRIKVQNALSKVEYTVQYVKDLIDQGHKVIIYTEHLRVVDYLSKNINSCKSITGATPAQKRMDIVSAFEEGLFNCLVGTIGSMSTGFNMTSCNHMVFNDVSWVPADNDQAEKRIHRIGQIKPCFYHVICSGRMDEMINKKLKEKNKVLEAVT